MAIQYLIQRSVRLLAIGTLFVATAVAQQPQNTGQTRTGPTVQRRSIPQNAAASSQATAGQSQRLAASPTGSTSGPVPAANRSVNQTAPNQTGQSLVVKTAPFRLSPQEQKRVDEILAYWEVVSDKVHTYTAKFQRNEYDPVFGPKDPKTPRTVGEGIIRYSAPDKGEFKLDTIGQYTPPTKPGGQPQYPKKPVEFDEHWICDGTSIYEFNTKTKQLIETKLPPDMQGQHIADGPLPFMFGAKKEKLKARYWIRELKPPADKVGQYRLEVHPKLREDAMNFSRVGVILDEKQYLPIALQIYPPNYDARKNWARTVYIFTDRQVNSPIDRGRQFLDRFISPKPPLGWKKVVSNYGQPVGPPASGPTPRNTATKPLRPGQPSDRTR